MVRRFQTADIKLSAHLAKGFQQADICHKIQPSRAGSVQTAGCCPRRHRSIKDKKNSLTNNIIDGQEISIHSLYKDDLVKYQQHLTLSDHGFVANIVSINSAKYNSLIKQHQSLIKKSVIQEMTKLQRIEERKKEDELISKLRDNHFPIDTLFHDDRQILKKKHCRA